MQYCVGGTDVSVFVFDLRYRRESGREAFAARQLCSVAPVSLTSEWELYLGDDMCGVTSAMYHKKGEILASYNDADIFLFSKSVCDGVVADVRSEEDSGEAAAKQMDRPSWPAAVLKVPGSEMPGTMRSFVPRECPLGPAPSPPRDGPLKKRGLWS